VGSFSAAPNMGTKYFKLGGQAALPLIWMICGQSDGLIFVSQNADAFLTDNKIPHTYKTMPGDHDWNVWKEGLTQFTQLIFK
jgi:enterochelin esterase-like enzyme